MRRFGFYGAVVIGFSIPMLQAQAATVNSAWFGTSDATRSVELEDLRARMGDSFNVEVPSFVGFQQEQSNWCWAAVAETIFYSLSGGRLDQAELARIRFNWDNSSPTLWTDDISGVDPESCQGELASSDRCNHSGNPLIALAFLGEAFSIQDYPASWSLDLFQRLRDSLAAGVPVGIQIDMALSETHEVVVYGASYQLDTSGDLPTANLSLKILTRMTEVIARWILRLTGMESFLGLGMGPFSWGIIHPQNLRKSQVPPVPCLNPKIEIGSAIPRIFVVTENHFLKNKVIGPDQ